MTENSHRAATLRKKSIVRGHHSYPDWREIDQSCIESGIPWDLLHSANDTRIAIERSPRGG